MGQPEYLYKNKYHLGEISLFAQSCMGQRMACGPTNGVCTGRALKSGVEWTSRSAAYISLILQYARKIQSNLCAYFLVDSISSSFVDFHVVMGLCCVLILCKVMLFVVCNQIFYAILLSVFCKFFALAHTIMGSARNEKRTRKRTNKPPGKDKRFKANKRPVEKIASFTPAGGGAGARPSEIRGNVIWQSHNHHMGI